MFKDLRLCERGGMWRALKCVHLKPTLLWKFTSSSPPLSLLPPLAGDVTAHSADGQLGLTTITLAPQCTSPGQAIKRCFFNKILQVMGKHPSGNIAICWWEVMKNVYYTCEQRKRAKKREMFLFNCEMKIMQVWIRSYPNIYPNIYISKLSKYICHFFFFFFSFYFS